LRISGEATLSAACTSTGQPRRRSADSIMSVSRVAAPIATPPDPTRMPFISGIVITSTRCSG
jgi:hypothetical protein